MYKILIVEDEEIERKALVDLLEEHFFETLIVYSATNGLEALEILKNPPATEEECSLPAGKKLPISIQANIRRKYSER